jgi:large subunit ribosomal protein L21
MDYAVIKTGGKQYLVKPGQKVRVEKLAHSTSSGQAGWKEGDKLTFDQVLLSGETVGTPLVKGAAVTATLKKIGRAAKVTVIKYKQKSRYFKKNGHRQPYFEIEIDSVK